MGIKKGDLRPKTHVPNLPPMLQKNLKIEEVSDHEEVMDTLREDLPRRFQSGIKITVVSSRPSSVAARSKHDSIFALKDLLIHSKCSKLKLDTLQKLRTKGHQIIFKTMMKQLMNTNDFSRLDPLIQIELLDIIAKQRHTDLLENIKKI